MKLMIFYNEYVPILKKGWNSLKQNKNYKPKNQKQDPKLSIGTGLIDLSHLLPLDHITLKV